MQIREPAGLVSETADPAHFSGRAVVTRMTGLGDRPAVNVYRVEFAPSARTDWHVHTGLQVLLVIDGCCRIQKWGEPIRRIHSGGVASIARGEKHWHGAEAASSMTHVAVNIDATTTWLEKVSDDQCER